jgi:hypothetical protein
MHNLQEGGNQGFLFFIQVTMVYMYGIIEGKPSADCFGNLRLFVLGFIAKSNFQECMMLSGTEV